MNLEAGLTRAQAAMFLGVAGSTVSMWAQDGWIAESGERRYLTTVGRPVTYGRLYRLGDLIDAERDTRNNPNSRRRTNPALLALA